MNPTVRLLLCGTLLAGMASTGCKKEDASAVAKLADTVADAVSDHPTAEENQKIAANAMPVAEVVAKLRAGVPEEELLAEVQRRRLTSGIVDANELELAANGADRKLIAAMRNPANVITEEQEQIYMQLVMQKQASSRAKK